MRLWREHGYEEVLRQLIDGSGWSGAGPDEADVAWSGSITKVRARLGVEPLRLLFARVAGPVATAGTPLGYCHAGTVESAPATEATTSPPTPTVRRRPGQVGTVAGNQPEGGSMPHNDVLNLLGRRRWHVVRRAGPATGYASP
jgi:hypothetical protein